MKKNNITFIPVLLLFLTSVIQVAQTGLVFEFNGEDWTAGASIEVPEFPDEKTNFWSEINN